MTRDANDIARECGVDGLRAAFDQTQPARPNDIDKLGPPAFTLYDEFDTEPRKEWLVRDFLGLGELSCIFGAPGSGKSVLAGDLAAHVAAGRSWFGRRVESGAVLYVAAERAALVKRRLAAFRRHHGLTGLPLGIMGGQFDLRGSHDHADKIIAAGQQLAAMFDVPLRLVEIDTVSRVLAGGDENSPKDMGALIGNLARIQDATGAHVCALHHIPADGSQRLRGHGALLGACDTTIKVEKIGVLRRASLDKSNDGPEDEAVAFDLESVQLHHDAATSITTTAPIVVPAEAPAETPAHAKLTANQQSMLNILDEAGPAGLTVDEWNDAARTEGIGKRRRTTLMDLRKALKDKGLVHSYLDRWYVTHGR